MNVDIRILLGLLGALLVGIFFGFAIVDQDWLVSISSDKDGLIMNVFTVAVGGFIGAYSAFWLKANDDDRKRNELQINALNSALLILIRQINAIHGIKRDFDQYIAPLDRAFSLPAMQPPNYSDLKQNIDVLSFLIDSRNPHMLMKLTIQQERFEQAINAINIRNNFYVNEVQPALSYHNLNGRPLPVREFEEKLGERLFQGAISGAEGMYRLVESCDRSVSITYQELFALSRELYPKGKFLKWVSC
ncbi:hypothetical protein [Cycloclasticus pugetii]|uniref:hypothetical protein n=1 Tax=Cycloclasticus pugetii TaxID=34068 RepID=UPI003A93E846